jgi:hypothetical protein
LSLVACHFFAAFFDALQETDKATADKLFNEIQEAYAVLSGAWQIIDFIRSCSVDPRKKGIYDTVGPLGLKETVLTQYDHTADEVRCKTIHSFLSDASQDQRNLHPA